MGRPPNLLLYSPVAEGNGRCARCKSEFPIGVLAPKGRYFYCRPCKQELWRTYYRRNKEKANKRSSIYSKTERGKEVSRRSHLKSTYNLSMEAYDLISQAQEGKCLICDSTPPLGQRLVVDENPATGEVRALLCRRCNMILGHLERSPEVLERFREYLRVFGSPPWTKIG